MRLPTTRRLKPGIYRNLSFEGYAEIEAINSTLLRRLGDGGRAAWHHRRFGTKVTDAMKAGSLAHIAILSRSEYLERVVEWTEPVYEERPALRWEKDDGVYVDMTTGRYLIERASGAWRGAFDGCILPQPPTTVTAAKAACKAHYEQTTPLVPKLDDDGRPKLAPQNPRNHEYKKFLERNPGRTVVTRKELEAADRVARAVRDNPEANNVLTGIWGTEVSIVWRDPETGVLCKGRIDWMTDPKDPRRVLFGDLKTCRDNAPPKFPRDAAGREYYAQMAYYRTGLRKCIRLLYGDQWDELDRMGGPPEIKSVLLAVQSGGCNDSTVYDLSEEDLEAGDRLNSDRIQQLLELEEQYPDRPWPGKCQRAPLSLGEHASWVFGENGDDSEMGFDLSGVERRGEEN